MVVGDDAVARCHGLGERGMRAPDAVGQHEEIGVVEQLAVAFAEEPAGEDDARVRTRV